MIIIIKITHIITGLELGGAERMLYKLLQNINRDKYEVEVISLTAIGVYGPKLEDLGIKVHAINMKRIPSIKNLVQIRSIIRDADIVQTWMDHADLLGYLATRFNKNKKLLWGIRRTSLSKEENSRMTLLIVKLNTLFSKRVDKIISCSIAAKQSYIDYGYSDNNFVIIPNGFEMDEFTYDTEARSNVRKNLGLEDKKIMINVGRWDITKDHKNLIKAYKKIEDSNTHLIMIGSEITYENNDLMKLIKETKIKSYSLLGPQSNVSDYLSAADIYVSSSMSEGFPNVVGEAMACELPCVVTDAGDSRYIVEDTGVVVPIKDSEKLAQGLSEMINLSNEERRELGKKSRKRVEEKFNIKVVTKMFEAQYE